MSIIQPIKDGYSHELRIPHERVAVLIGKSGKTKSEIEKATSVKLDIDSKEASIVLSGDDAVDLMIASDIVKAVGRGFNPEIAMQLLKSDYGLFIIDITEFARNQNDHTRVRGRVIGEGGKSRQTIEDLTGSHVSVYGKTVAILGEATGLDHARRAVTMLLEGSPHRNVYKWLEHQRKMRGLEALGLSFEALYPKEGKRKVSGRKDKGIASDETKDEESEVPNKEDEISEVPSKEEAPDSIEDKNDKNES